jgi:hypothetical protein
MQDTTCTKAGMGHDALEGIWPKQAELTAKVWVDQLQMAATYNIYVCEIA